MNIGGKSASKRPYRMRARAEMTEQTHQRIVTAFIELFAERWLAQLSLEDVATRADVTVQTVLRRFGSKDGLIAAAGEALRHEVESQRGQAPVGDVPGAVGNLFDHYEQVGDLVLRALEQEGMYPAIRVLTDRGRLLHHDWVTHTFAPQLAQVSGEEYTRLLSQLIAITDVYVWKLLRRDLKLPRSQAELAMREMIDGLRGGTDRI